MYSRKLVIFFTVVCLLLRSGVCHATDPSWHTEHLTRADYIDRVQAAWTAQIIACLMGFQFEHKVAAVEWVQTYPKKYETAPVDDDWYYEMCAVRAFEKHGIDLTVEQLGEQWKENSCGSWGASEEARLNLLRGIKAPDCGHPRYNRLWFAIGPQFSCEVYGLVAPGMPNIAAKLARNLGHVNGYAEAIDGATFVSGMVSLGFVEKDTHTIVKKAAQLIPHASPYRKMLDQVIASAESGKSSEEIANETQDRWRMEYPASVNSVANGALVAIAVWFGEGNYLKTVNLAYRLADFTDSDCNAANAGAVIAAMHGIKCLPQNLVEPLHDRIVGDKLGDVTLTPPVDEKISDLARRTAAIGERFIQANGGKISGEKILSYPPVEQAAELFTVADLTKYWNPDWKLERAGYGGAGWGRGNTRGNSHLEGEILATWPRDPARGVVLRRDVKLSAAPVLTFQAGADSGRAWELAVYANNQRVFRKEIDGGTKAEGERVWENVSIDLQKFAGKTVQLRLYQRVSVAERIPGNALWKAVTLK